MGCNSSQSTQVLDSAENRPKSAKSLNKSLQSSSYKLHYFDFTGKAEVIRLVFAAGNLKYEDLRFKFEDWPQIKPTMPLGQVPVLEISNEPLLVQSLAIARLIAKETGLAGRDSLEMAKADAVVDTAVELSAEYYKVFLELRNPTDNKDLIMSNFFAILPKHLANLETLIKLYGSDGYFVGDQLTWADLYVYDLLSNIIQLNQSCLNGFELIKINREKIKNNERLSTYFQH